jgi:hypothetical protein
MPAADAQRLLDIVARESRSLLMYVSESFPWPTPQEREVLAQLQKIIAEESETVVGLGRFLVRQRIVPPPLRTYPQAFTSVNYVSLDHLLPMLAAYQREAVARLQREQAALYDAEARAQVGRLIEVKRRHLEALEAMAAAHPQKLAS